MTSTTRWTRNQLLVAFSLYCRLSFGKLHYRNPEIVKYANVIGRSPSALAMKLTNIASLDPVIRSTGRTGLTKVSLLDRQMWDEMQSDWDRFAVEAHQAIVDLTGELPDPNSVDESEPSSILGEDKVVQTTARIGQWFFRAAVLSAYNERCCISGLSMPKLLVASHIVPWRHDKLNRVNPKNGLLLSALHDKAFDAGIITVNEDLTVRVSEITLMYRDSFFSNTIRIYTNQPIHVPEKFSPDPEFLAYHREHVFQG